MRPGPVILFFVAVIAFIVSLFTSVSAVEVRESETLGKLNNEALFGDGSTTGKLDFPTGIDEALAGTCLDSYLNSVAPTSPLKGKGASFVSAGKRYNVNPALLIAIAGIESSFATANTDKLNYNFVNIRPVGGGGFMSYGSWEEGIDAEAKLLGTGYIHATKDKPLTTIAEIGPVWAPPSDNNDTNNWVTTVTRYFNEIQSHCPTLVVKDIPSGGGTATGTAAQKLVAWTKDHSGETDQDALGCSCALAAQLTLERAFPGSNGRGDSGWIRTFTASDIGKAPDSKDLEDAQRILSDGNLPVWHIRGNGTGQHWIILVGIDGDSISFFDPTGGVIRTKPRTEPSTKFPGEYYFGVTDQQGANDDSQFKRGYVFRPASK